VTVDTLQAAERAGTVKLVHVAELDEVTDEQWAELIDDEVEPWGGGPGERMSWQQKEWYVAVRSVNETLLALAGAAVATVDVEDGSSFEVLGIGGVFVRASQRGRGLALLAVKHLLARAEADTSSPGRAMLFCRPHLTGFYAKFGFEEIEAPVWAQQPGGRVEVPMPAMWRPLSDDTDWPPGRVDVHGLPF
jgi:GNAT superfamily N-acetyltransferase